MSCAGRAWNFSGPFFAAPDNTYWQDSPLARYTLDSDCSRGQLMSLPQARTVGFKSGERNIFFHVLTACNLSCRHCYINPEGAQLRHYIKRDPGKMAGKLFQDDRKGNPMLFFWAVNPPCTLSCPMLSGLQKN